VVAVIGYHHMCRRLLRRFETSGQPAQPRWFRVFNEVSVLLFIAIVCCGRQAVLNGLP
jgi:putative membrane protein